MNDNSEEETLKIIDTKNNLTVEELQELKKLVAMAKSARMIIAFVIGGIMLVGGDKVIDLMQSHASQIK